MQKPEPSSPPATLVAPRAPSPPAAPLALVVESGPDAGRALALHEGEFVVGSAADCALPLTDALISRRHLRIDVDDRGAVTATDLGSTNGTFYEQAQIRSLRLGAGGRLRLGDTLLRLRPANEAVDAADTDGLTTFGALRARAPRMREALASARRLATTELALLLQGEPGTGKERLAEAVHRASARAAGPFVCVDAAAVAREALEAELFGDGTVAGAFEQAAGGTLFLASVDELAGELQVRLLRAIERRQVKRAGEVRWRVADARVLAATTRALTGAADEGPLRRDLLERFAGAIIALPPLRDRRADIPGLVEELLASLARQGVVPRVAPAVMAQLEVHDWPGNVRQLQHVLERAAALAPDGEVDGRVLGLDARPARAWPPGRPPRFKEAKERLVDEWEREYVTAMLERTGGNVSLAAKRAGIARAYLYLLLRKHGLTR